MPRHPVLHGELAPLHAYTSVAPPSDSVLAESSSNYNASLAYDRRKGVCLRIEECGWCREAPDLQCWCHHGGRHLLLSPLGTNAAAVRALPSWPVI